MSLKKIAEMIESKTAEYGFEMNVGVLGDEQVTVEQRFLKLPRA